MKKIVLSIALFVTVSTIIFATESAALKKSQLVGSWKYITQSRVNDFQKITNTIAKEDYVAEYFIFEENNKFRHEFINKDDVVIRIFKGKWKFVNNKIKIEYVAFRYTLTLDYFFLDQDLVLGQHFNHIIFRKEDVLNPMAINSETL